MDGMGLEDDVQSEIERNDDTPIVQGMAQTHCVFCIEFVCTRNQLL